VTTQAVIHPPPGLAPLLVHSSSHAAQALRQIGLGTSQVLVVYPLSPSLQQGSAIWAVCECAMQMGHVGQACHE